MDTDLLLLINSFCRLRMQARPIFSTSSRTFVDDVDALIEHWQHSRSEQTATFQVFLKVLSYASVEAETRREQLIGPWLLSSLLVKMKADVDKFYWQCERTRRILRPPLQTHYFVDRRDNSILGSLSLSSEAARPQKKGTAQRSFSSHFLKSFHNGIPVVETAGYGSPIIQSNRNLQPLEIDFVLSDCAESKNVVNFCTQMIQKRKFFRSCCVRSLDDCCHAGDLEVCLSESSVQVVFVQQCISKIHKEAFRRRNVLFLDRLGRNTADVSEKKLGWRVFENFSDWFFSIRTKSSRTSWRCWATTMQHQFGLTLKLRIRHYPNNTTKSTPSIQSSWYGVAKKPLRRETNSGAMGTEVFGTGSDIEVFLLRNSCLAAVLCGSANGEENCDESAKFVRSYEASLRTLDMVCQLCRVVM
ncbi:hypothetical protein LtaPh_2724300 [Leishmania tarentolae]|uniref:Uncharacterized protein n=1 Tax=Leishmania tarentolae TaxID=5689 RepID=A0A640KJK8_LEITA|nr:hypothetical protein LtaPh_2724300 [Leishmania tarentolae]